MAGWDGSEIIFCAFVMVRVWYRVSSDGSGVPMIFDAFFIMRCSLLREWVARLPYQTVIEEVRML